MHDTAEVDAPFAPLKPNEIVPVAAPASEGELVLPVPADAPPMPETHFELGQPSERWSYRDATGRLLFEVRRFDKSDGGKEFRPLTLWRDAQGLRWRWKSVPPPWPLYNLDKLAGRPDAPVIICEGEKVGRCGGADFSRNRWRRLPPVVRTRQTRRIGACFAGVRFYLARRRRPGPHYAGKVGAMLAALDCDVSMIDATHSRGVRPVAAPRTIQKGWDAANAIAEWHRLGGAAACGRQLRQAVSRTRLHFVWRL